MNKFKTSPEFQIDESVNRLITFSNAEEDVYGQID